MKGSLEVAGDLQMLQWTAADAIDHLALAPRIGEGGKNIRISQRNVAADSWKEMRMTKTNSNNPDKALPPGIAPSGPAKSFSEHVAKINATKAFFEALAKQPDHGPTINLNLLRYRPKGDSSRYDLYGAVAGKAIAGVGEKI